MGCLTENTTTRYGIISIQKTLYLVWLLLNATAPFCKLLYFILSIALTVLELILHLQNN